MKIAIIIPVLNDAAELGETLADLRRHWLATEICVVDGGSRDDSVEVAEKMGDRVRRDGRFK